MCSVFLWGNIDNSMSSQKQPDDEERQHESRDSSTNSDSYDGHWSEGVLGQSMDSKGIIKTFLYISMIMYTNYKYCEAFMAAIELHDGRVDERFLQWAHWASDRILAFAAKVNSDEDWKLRWSTTLPLDQDSFIDHFSPQVTLESLRMYVGLQEESQPDSSGPDGSRSLTTSDEQKHLDGMNAVVCITADSVDTSDDDKVTEI